MEGIYTANHKKIEFTKDEIENYVKERLKNGDWKLYCIRTASKGPYPTEECKKSIFFQLLDQDKIQGINLKNINGKLNEFFSYNNESGKFKRVEKLTGFK